MKHLIPSWALSIFKAVFFLQWENSVGCTCSCFAFLRDCIIGCSRPLPMFTTYTEPKKHARQSANLEVGRHNMLGSPTITENPLMEYRAVQRHTYRLYSHHAGLSKAFIYGATSCPFCARLLASIWYVIARKALRYTNPMMWRGHGDAEATTTPWAKATQINWRLSERDCSDIKASVFLFQLYGWRWSYWTEGIKKTIA